MQNESFKFTGDPATYIAQKVRVAFDEAIAGNGKLPPELLAMQGMSGKKYRLLINALVESMPDARYLEVGSWAGSTLCSAIHGNDVDALAIDNWSEFGGPMSQFFTNLGIYCTNANRISILNSDFRKVNYGNIGKYNIYLFDGPHAKEDQYDGVYFALPALDKEVVFIVDDWNWPFVQEGTREALAAVSAEISYSIEIFSTEGGVHPADIGLPVDQDSDWHNGYFIGVLRIP
jgi:hypothetical protein